MTPRHCHNHTHPAICGHHLLLGRISAALTIQDTLKPNEKCISCFQSFANSTSPLAVPEACFSVSTWLIEDGHSSRCGNQANSCYNDGGSVNTAPLNVWIRTGCYVLIDFLEIFASITSLEYA